MIYFATGDNAFNFMKELRWSGKKPLCPCCQCEETSFLSTRKLWKCKGCKKQFSVKVGTIFEDSPLGLDKWLCAIWMIRATTGHGVRRICDVLGVPRSS